MSLEAYVVAEMLQRMEQQGAVLHPSAVDIAAALNMDSMDEYPVAHQASAELTRALDAFVTTTDMLKGHIVACDGMGPLGESPDELKLRARWMVVDAELDRLRRALGEPVPQTRVRAWFSGQFRSFADLEERIRDRKIKIHAMWMPHRRDQPQLPGVTETDRAVLYRMMVGAAQRALRQLWEEPELASFLEQGLAASDLTEIQAACRQIATVLGVDIKPRRFRPANAAVERR